MNFRGDWTKSSWAPLWQCGYGLENSTVGIIGAGRIGASVAKKVNAFNIKKLLYFSRMEKPERKMFFNYFNTNNIFY